MNDNPLKSFYDAVIGLIVDLLGPEDDELVIVSNGELCLTPWAAIIKWIRICIAPSLMSYQLVLSVPESHHNKTGALLVGIRTWKSWRDTGETCQVLKRK